VVAGWRERVMTEAQHTLAEWTPGLGGMCTAALSAMPVEGRGRAEAANGVLLALGAGGGAVEMANEGWMRQVGLGDRTATEHAELGHA
jgi:hypothetical protein